jgi:catechol 2,3-dioxygenase-like lactoylglutathione lyase family enzyme
VKIHHFAYEVSDLDGSIRFYTEKLGFRLQLDRIVDGNEHEAFAILEMDGGKLELIQALTENNEPQPFEPFSIRPHCCPHLAIQVEDLDRVVEQLKVKGIPIVHGPLEAPGVAKWLYASDPDGNVIEFCYFPDHGG